MACGADFDSWLTDKLQTLNTDETVFGPYIKSVVEGDESRDEKIDAIDGLLAELADDSLDVEAFREEILSRWKSELENKKGVDVNGIGDNSTDLDSKLADILKINDELAMVDSKSKSSADSLDKTSKNLAPASDSALRAAILNQYKDDTDSDSGEDKEKSKTASTRGGGSGGGSSGLEKNTNAERVMNDMKDRRDKEKADAAKKREKDREDRAKQKQLQQDRKEKAKKKATKVERKR